MTSFDDLNVAFDALLVRVNQLDGIGLSNPKEASVAKLNAQIAGLKETLNQSVLLLDAHLTELQASIDALTQLLNSHLST